ncbi:MAG TPA: acetyl ornithine aminotransferase family protein [Candidatus Bathyarchaeia archaeon]|nr:acetyl ornithine aminotransferase family protein [Candidatus Bathyarchaeia archaeon]
MPAEKYPHIVATPPGPKARALVARDQRLISGSLVRFYPLVAESGQGSIVRDVDGNEYIDFNSGLVCLAVGHSHPRVVAAIKNQAEKLIHYSWTDFYYEKVVEMSEQLVKITPGNFGKKVFLSNSGTEAIEAAMKLAKWHTRKHIFLSFIGAFHGRTLGSLSLTASKPYQRRHFFPMVPGDTHVPFAYCYRCPFKLSYPECGMYCVDFIQEQVLDKYLPAEDVAAMFVEPIQGEGGYVVPPDDYFKRLKKLLDKNEILMADDEVQAGMGRTGRWFGIEHWDVEPDIISTSKALASGMPIGATVSKAELMDWEGGAHANTFGGNPVSCAAALEVINIIRDEHLLENATKQGAYIMKRLKEMQEKYPIIGDVRGKGLMIGAEIVKDPKTKEYGDTEAHDIMMKAFRRGVAIITAGRSTLRIAPPLVITRDLVDSGLDVLEGAIKEVNSSAK